jgi:cytochrome c5
MSNKDNSYKSSTLKQLIIVIPGTILAFTLLISVIAKLAADKPSNVTAVAEAPKTVINTNITPVAVVEVAAAESGPHADKSGEEVYKAVCTMCHAAGLMNAPKFGDKSLWAPRVAQGYDKLVSNAINGIRAMPAKGGNAALTDGEVAGAVKYMANASGASFK